MIKWIEEKDCTGCSACYSSCPIGAISMVANSEGFLYPQIDDSSCITCGRCSKICPVTNEKKKNGILKSFVAVNNNKSERVASSSGGIFSIIANYVLNEGGWFSVLHMMRSLS